jgi:hypothetical protein
MWGQGLGTGPAGICRSARAPVLVVGRQLLPIGNVSPAFQSLEALVKELARNEFGPV